MKEIIKVEVKSKKADPAGVETDLLVVGHFSGPKGLDRTGRELDKRLGGAISRVIELGDFKGKSGDSAIFYGEGKVAARRVLLVGLGEKTKAGPDTFRQAAALAANKAVELKARTLSLALHAASGGRFDAATLAQVIAEGTYYGSYRYDEYVTDNDDGRLSALEVELIDSDLQRLRKLKAPLARGTIIGRAQSYARTIANRPGNVINPPALAQEAKKLAAGTPGLTCTVLDEKQMKQKGMGGVLAVGGGSSRPPRFIVVRYVSKHAKASKLPRVALVGKAITFDSGGISIKPAANMDQMKLDKSGGLAVLATMKAVAELKLPIEVYGIIPSAENMPGGASFRPGDIVTTYSKKTVEVQNTDAEGRMILCDGIEYAVKQGCDVIIDIATLTGACMVALGKYMAGLMSNDKALARQLKKAAEMSGEKLWQLPSGEEYAEEMKSKIADLKNIGSKWGGACTAAAFLRQFAGEKKWAHIDMAGMDVFEKAKESVSAGASGYGVRLLTTYLMNLANKKD